MSTTLPIVTLPAPSTAAASPDLVQQLLAEQQSLTAVEEFSALHETGEIEPVQARYYQKLLPATPPGPGQQFSFEVDLDQCSGCKACVVACHTMNGLDEDESWRRVGTLTIGDFQTIEAEQPRIQHVTTACHHCEDPGCLNGCPVKAYDKDPITGIVRHLDDQCIGCKYCTMMCPYEVPQYSERLGIVRKCDMCHQRLSAGEAPACVQSCPNEAIKIRVVDVGQAEAKSSLAAKSLAPGAPPSSITLPTTVYKSQRISSSTNATPQDDQVDSVAESHWPLAIMLVATQISVGILFAERMAATLGWLIGGAISDQATRWSATVALLIAGAGMGIAPLHLGQPLRAWRVFLGLRTSWLSREAVVLGKYMGLLTATTGLLWMPLLVDYLPTSIVDMIPSWAAKATLGLSIAVGLVGLISSAMIYVATKRQLWRIARTFTRFLGTAVVGGAAWAIPILIYSSTSTPVSFLILFAGLFALAGKLAWEWGVYFDDEYGDQYDLRSRKLITGPLVRTTNARSIVGFASLGLLALALLSLFFSPTLATIIAFTAAIAISGGELLERLLYFQSVVYDRMPGTLK